MLRIFNSLTKQKEFFKPIQEGHIGLYVCGNTVYDYCHIGHARSMILFDVIVRYLRSAGWEVTHVRNITDIDDKIIKRANENKESCSALTERFIAEQHADEKALNLLTPTSEPRATEYVPQIIALIERIIQRGHAYVTDDGDVYFDVRSFKEYGKLSHRDIDALQSGVRIDIGDAKRDPLDFVLWKAAKPGEPTWDSPWGLGRPGWHIECSAMSTGLLGQPFDIHGGGLDLKFPHHENEITQSESACDTQFANWWMHIGLLQIDDEKMSKSLNNFITIKQALTEHHPEVIRYFMISAHYRSSVNYTVKSLRQIRQGLERLYAAIDGLPKAEVIEGEYEVRFHAAMEDDFNTPVALAVLFDMAREINRYKETKELDLAAGIAARLKKLARSLGLLNEVSSGFLKSGSVEIDAARVEALIAERNKARDSKDWVRADEIRDELAEMQITILDSKDGTTWRAN